LQAGEGTNHENSCSKTLPESGETDFTVNLRDLSTSGLVGSGSLVEDGDHGISWMGDDGAENTGNITGHESDSELGTLTVAGLLSGEDVSVEHLHDLFEGDELHNGVWYLSAPKWGQSFVETVGTFGGFQVSETCSGGFGELAWLRSLHFDLKSFPWAEETIGNDLSASR